MSAMLQSSQITIMNSMHIVDSSWNIKCPGRNSKLRFFSQPLILIQCHMLLHLICVFTVCQRTMELYNQSF